MEEAKLKKEDNAEIIAEYPTSVTEGKKFTYNYWKNKPVSNFDETPVFSKNIETDLTQRKVYGNDEPIKLPSSMKWVEIDINDTANIETICKFLRAYYLVDDSGKYKLDYTKEFVKWAIESNGILLTIVSEKNNAICGVVSASFRNMTVFEGKQTFGVVNFLCAHPVYRKKKIAYTLIDEIIRRIVKKGVHQGCFTTERCVPSPTSTLRFYHRPINYVKLNKFGFTDLELDKTPEQKNPEKIQKKIAVEPVIPSSYKPMELKHIPDVYRVYNKYINKYNIYSNYTTKELEHFLLNSDTVSSYVIVDNDNEIVDFVSYYKLNYFMDDTVEKITTAYLFLYSCNEINSTDFIDNLLKVVSHNKLDMLNVTDTMIISDCLFTHETTNGYDSDEDTYSKQYQHGFLKGSGKLHFNFFNWKCPTVLPKQLSWFAF